jgi:hypothetical protein
MLWPPTSSSTRGLPATLRRRENKSPCFEPGKETRRLSHKIRIGSSKMAVGSVFDRAYAFGSFKSALPDLNLVCAEGAKPQIARRSAGVGNSQGKFADQRDHEQDREHEAKFEHDAHADALRRRAALPVAHDLSATIAEAWSRRRAEPPCGTRRERQISTRAHINSRAGETPKNIGRPRDYPASAG